ncbi:hypothetical protein [Sphingopyxis sp. JAI128]|uniref:hypothetical protein n=1 Tax=Sphingopyxis sp. JAI128 TaxID=2723066 RepID=UPI00181BF02D|nr:hypothetical protein [Sphingopyxis sp. JAI128]MBB6427671.1 arginine/ornithine N-succinyltransferase beta subunit [Sphingopyxis sp. JAI128]
MAGSDERLANFGRSIGRPVVEQNYFDVGPTVELRTYRMKAFADKRSDIVNGHEDAQPGRRPRFGDCFCMGAHAKG